MTQPKLRALVLAPALLLIAACAADTARRAPTAGPAAEPATTAIVRVPERFMTPPMREREIDSVAAWRTPDGGTWLIATAKASNQLVVYDGDTGATLRTVGSQGDAPGQFFRPNGIAVHGDLVFVVERDNQRVQMLRLPDFAPAGEFGHGELLNPYGIWLRELEPGVLEVLVTDSFMADFRTELVPPMDELDGRVKRYRVAVDGA